MRPFTLRHSTACAVLCCAAVVAPVGASGAPVENRVRATNLPTANQVEQIFEGFTGGHRSIRTRVTETLIRADTCTGFQGATPARQGKAADYTLPDGGSLYWLGLEDPTIALQRFATRRQARTYWHAVNAADTNCVGEHGTRRWSSVLSLMPVPQLTRGGTFGLWEHIENQSSAGVDGYDRAVVRARRGRYLIEAEVRSATSQPDKQKILELVRITLDRLG